MYPKLSTALNKKISFKRWQRCHEHERFPLFHYWINVSSIHKRKRELTLIIKTMTTTRCSNRKLEFWNNINECIEFFWNVEIISKLEEFCFLNTTLTYNLYLFVGPMFVLGKMWVKQCFKTRITFCIEENHLNLTMIIQFFINWILSHKLRRSPLLLLEK